MSKIFVDEIAGIASADTVAIPGHVIQVVNAESEAETTTTSTSYIDTTLEATITPTSTSSKILVIVQCALGQQTSTGNGSGTEARVYKGSTPIGKVAMAKTRENLSSGNTDNTQGGGSLVVYNSPSTTSATTYKVRIRSRNSAVTAKFNNDDSGSSITLMEIAG